MKPVPNPSIPLVLTPVILLLATFTARPATTTNVSYGYYFFDPPVVTIHVGDTVNWSSSSPFHTLAGTDGGSSPDDVICGGSSLPCSHTFTTAGTYTYECTVHALENMTGAVIVASVALPPPTPAVLTNGGFNGSGHFQFTITTPANQTNVVQASTSLSSTNWVSLDTNGAGGSFVFTDTNAPSFPLRFYRVISPQ